MHKKEIRIILTFLHVTDTMQIFVILPQVGQASRETSNLLCFGRCIFSLKHCGIILLGNGATSKWYEFVSWRSQGMETSTLCCTTWPQGGGQIHHLQWYDENPYNKIKTESIRKLSSFNFPCTRIISIKSHSFFFFTFFKGYRCTVNSL